LRRYHAESSRQKYEPPTAAELAAEEEEEQEEMARYEAAMSRYQRDNAAAVEGEEGAE
jgi:hypothetical protein